MIVYLLLAGVRIDDRDRTGLVRIAAILGLMMVGYFFVYVMTPLDLGYHLATSLNRLFLQLWPSVIFLFFMIAGSPEMSPAEGTGDRSREAGKQNRPGRINQGSQRSRNEHQKTCYPSSSPFTMKGKRS